MAIGGGLCHEEIRAKKAAEEAAALKAAQEAAAAKAANGDDEEDQPSAKRRKRISEDAEEIDEESEMLYAQAIQDVDEEVDEGEAEDTPLISSASAQKKRPPSSPATAVPGKRLKSKGNKLNTGCAASFPAVRTAAHTQDKLEKPSTVATSSSASHADVPRVVQPTWGKCKSIGSLNLSQEGCGDLFAMPEELTKDVQKSKWKAECVRLQPYLLPLEKILLSTDGTSKISDQVIKSSITQLKKVNAKTDKKLEYTSESNEQKLMSVRVLKLRSALESVKDLRTLALQGVKTTIDRKTLIEAIGKVQGPFHELNNQQWIGLPEHWVQAGQGRESVIHFW